MTRERILDILLEVTRDGKYCHIALRDAFSRYSNLDKKERAFITRVVEGTLERMIEIDYIIDQFSTLRTSRMKPVICCILRSAVYQLKYMDSVPDAAACSEAVKLAEKRGFRALKGFVNGVLRNIARNPDKIVYPDKADAAAHLSVCYSMPDWIVRQWLGCYSRETVETMLADFLEEKPVTIRCRERVMSQEDMIRSLEREGVQVRRHPYLPYAFRISSYDSLANLQSFRAGAFYVQDIGSMLAGHIAQPKGDEYVIDVCAAPGGKALHVADLLQGRGHVEARDLTDGKVRLIRENIARCSVKNVEAVKWDATVPDLSVTYKADIVIADLPCSGLGVAGRKPDLKYKMTQKTQEELVLLQRKILSVAHAYVKPGGTLIYSTCTINEAENTENARWFLREHPEFAPEPIRDLLCGQLQESVRDENCMQLLPGIHESDGFFIAKFRKARHG